MAGVIIFRGEFKVVFIDISDEAESALNARHFLCSHTSNKVNILQFVKDSRDVRQDYD